MHPAIHPFTTRSSTVSQLPGYPIIGNNNSAHVVGMLWSELRKDTPNYAYLSRRVLRELGHDGAGLSDDDIANAICARDGAYLWRDVGWACREAFLGYNRIERECVDSFIAYVAMSCLWSDAITRKHLEWDSSFDEIIRFAHVNISLGSSLFRIRWFGYMLRSIP
jgi:hypothetical protein